MNVSGVVDLIRQLRAQVLHDPQPLGGGTILLPIPYYMTLYKGYIQMTFFSRDSQVGVSKLVLLLH